MIEFLLAVLICLLVCCIAAFGWPVRDSNFWTVVAPAYMQGIGTIAATVLAAMAYVAWRRPDDTRRVAEFAQTLIRESRKLELAALEARYNTYIHLEGDKADRLFAEKVAHFLMVVEKPVSAEKVEALRHQVNLLDTFQVEAKHYFGADTSKALSSFHDMCSELAEYFQGMARDPKMVRYIARSADEGAVEPKIMLDRTMRAIGIDFVMKGQYEPAEKSWVHELRSKGTVLREELAKYLSESQ